MTDLAYAIVYYYDLTPLPLVLAVLLAVSCFVGRWRRRNAYRLAAALVLVGCYHVYSSLLPSLFLWLEAVVLLAFVGWRTSHPPPPDEAAGPSDLDV